MKNMLRTAVLAVALIFASAPALAQDFEFKPYVGVGLGGFNIELDALGLLSDSDTAFGGYGLVGADFNDYLGAELRVGTTANATLFGAVDVGVDYFISYLAKVQYPATPELRVYGLIGGTTAKATTSVVGFPDESYTETGVSFGAGLDYRIMDQVIIGAEWVRYWHNVEVEPGLEAIVDGFSGLVKYEF